MIKIVFILIICCCVLYSSDVFAADGAFNVTSDGVIFPDGTKQKTAATTTTNAYNPFANYVKKTCSYAELKATGQGKCYCPSAPLGYKSVAIQGGIVCDDGTPNRHPSVESAGAVDDWYGGYCKYIDFDIVSGAVISRFGDVPQQVFETCLFVQQ
jgi:hypothetical protein